jgi:hypothetical protein
LETRGQERRESPAALWFAIATIDANQVNFSDEPCIYTLLIEVAIAAFGAGFPKKKMRTLKLLP